MRNIVLVGVLGLTACGKGKLGTVCADLDDCKGGLVCGTKPLHLQDDDARTEAAGALDNVCVGPQLCATSKDCQDLGDHAICIGLGVCVRECRQDADCTEQTYCRNHAFCAR